MKSGNGGVLDIGGTVGFDTYTGNLTDDSFVLSPGDSPGTTTIDGDYTQEAGGTLNVSMYGGYVPTIGDSFDIMDWGSLTGTFGTLVLSSPGARPDWDTSRLYTEGALDVVHAAPEPSAGALFGLGRPRQRPRASVPRGPPHYNAQCGGGDRGVDWAACLR